VNRRNARLILAAKGVRAVADGFVSVLLPAYFLALGFDAARIGALATVALIGAAATTLAVGFLARRTGARQLYLWVSVLMALTGLALAGIDGYWPLLVVAFVGTVNPSASDVSAFLPLDQAALAHVATDHTRTTLFSRYSLVGSLAGAAGAQAAALPVVLAEYFDATPLALMRAMFVLYAVLGGVAGVLYRKLGRDATATEAASAPTSEPAHASAYASLGPSRGKVLRLAALFSVDAFAGGFIVQSMLALWLLQAFELSLVTAATIFFWLNLLNAASYLLAPALARRYGLINTMVFTHIPSSMFLIAAAFALNLWVALLLLSLRGLLSQMDVPTRSSYVMAIVTPPERAAAAAVTTVPRSLAAAASPALAGALLAASPFAWPLVVCGALKIGYDLALLAMFRRVQPPE
jgi:MFS family permease